MLKATGREVTGSDQNVYPPMSDMLRTWAIPVLTPYDPANLDAVKPDLVVIGNVVRRVNPEATEVRARRLPQMSFPAALGASPAGSSFRGRGRHAWQDHDDGPARARAGGGWPGPLLSRRRRRAELPGELPARAGPHFVVEGDEYDTAYFDKGPKFSTTDHERQS